MDTTVKLDVEYPYTFINVSSAPKTCIEKAHDMVKIMQHLRMKYEECQYIIDLYKRENILVKHENLRLKIELDNLVKHIHTLTIQLHGSKL